MKLFVSIVLIVSGAALLTAVAVVINYKSVGTTVVNSQSEDIIQALAIDEMLICDAFGDCDVVVIPLSQEEQAVVAGTKDISARAVYNADQPGGAVYSFDRIYGRALIKPTAANERWYQQIDFGRSWNGLTEVTITPGDQGCNSVVVSGQAPYRIDATMDNTTCDGDGQPAVIRWAAKVIENDIQNCPNPKAASCKPFAPITVLPSKRKGSQVYYGDELARVYQLRVILGEPLP